jgi:hypothetical protein
LICIGDSIATYAGLGGAVPCSQVYAIKGIPSRTIIGEAAKSGIGNECIVSAGSNDPLNLNLEKNLEAIRKNLKCPIIVWVKPANHRASAIVQRVASEYGDRTVQVHPGKDGVHPRSYAELARQITGNNLYKHKR